MADDEFDEEMEDDGDAGIDDDELEEGGSGGSKKLFIVIGVALFLIVGGMAGAYFMGLLDPLIEMVAGGDDDASPEAKDAAAVAAGDAVFLDLTEMMVNLNTGGRKPTYLKIRVSLELEHPEDVPKVEHLMPRVMDNFQVYLRELRVEDLKGSAGMYRLREELLTRVSAAVAPVQVHDVLFKEMIVQ
jgi:flagellar protein FliL